MANSKYVNFLEGLLVGGSLGAAATFLFGTKQGKELQKKIVKKYQTLEHKAEHYIHNAEKAAKGPMAKKLKRLLGKAIKKRPTSKLKRRKSTRKVRK